MRRYAETGGPVIEHYRQGQFHRLNAEMPPGVLLEAVEAIVDSKESARSAVA